MVGPQTPKWLWRQARLAGKPESVTPPTSPVSLVLQTPAAPAAEAHRHFLAKLAVETDPSDVHYDLRQGVPGFVVVDTRSAAAYAEMHVPGALNLPARAVHERNVEGLRGKVVVVYCWAASCNAATKAAVKLSALGLQVKEMLGGLDAWVREGYPVEGELADGANFDEYLRRHHRGDAGPPAGGGR